MNLALLLLGPGNLHKSRWYITALGTLLFLVGLFIAIDASDTVTLITLEAFGWVLAAMGLAKLAFSLLAGGGGMPSMFCFQGILYVVLGVAIADFPQHSGNAVPWLFGLALLLNGLYQLLSALVIRYPNWVWFLVSGIGHLLFGGLLFYDWKGAIGWVVPLFLGGGLILMGLTTLRSALRLGRYMRGHDVERSEMAVRYFLDFHVPGRFCKQYLAFDPVAPPTVNEEHGDLLVHVWSPAIVTQSDINANLVTRYVAARDSEGKYAVGHSALELSPDVYISHCDGDPTAFDTEEEVWQTLRSKDVSGVFVPSFEEEIRIRNGLLLDKHKEGAAHPAFNEELRTYVPPSGTVRFKNFSPGQLRTFWAMYSTVTDYNFTNRNCSVAVALALEVALMGSLDTGQRFRTLLSLLTNRDLWVAHFIRWKAREMVWTPGIMLEYAVALQRVVEG